MFFSAELLASRDSGFGLLWLAATLGSKSTFKKLPKRSILTADIAQLCDLIAQPSEPLALRLTSNLLVGVARVYKVKQEMFMSDVTNCFTSVKKMVQESQSGAVMDERLQMAQASARPSAVTFFANPRTPIAMDFDALVADWDEYLNIGGPSLRERDIDDEEFDSKESQTNPRSSAKAAAPCQSENARAELHTLTEHHDHLLSASFDLSHHSIGNGVPDTSSSQAADYGFEDNFFAAADGLGIGELADELAQELGWTTQTPMNGQQAELTFEENLGLGLNLNAENEQAVPSRPIRTHAHQNSLETAPRSLKRKASSHSDKGDESNPEAFQSPTWTLSRALSPATSFSRLLLSQDEQPAPPSAVTKEEQSRTDDRMKKMKKTRLLLDARTELTDEELKTARTQYLQAQNMLRREIENKQSERNCGRTLEEKVCGVPACIHAPALIDFWQENFKVQVEARTGTLYIHPSGDRPRKRQKIKGTYQTDLVGEEEALPGIFDQNNIAIDINLPAAFGDEGAEAEFQNHFRSSEEPGQGRRLSHPPSVLLDLALDLTTRIPESGSQKGSLFPWDNAGGSSSNGTFGMPGSDADVHFDHVETRMRGSSGSRRGSSLIPSQVGSLAGGPGFSPAPVKRVSQVLGEDYVFEVEMQEQSATLESQRSNMNLTSLERNSYNFLEYAKMQSHSLPSSTASLTFDVVVPQLTSTRHVAASAFYHCLVLATKNLLRLRQTDPHGQLIITIV